METDVLMIMILFFVIGGGGITAVVMYMEIKKHRPVKAAIDADQYIVPGETRMTNTEDAFLRTHETRTRVTSGSKR